MYSKSLQEPSIVPKSTMYGISVSTWLYSWCSWFAEQAEGIVRFVRLYEEKINELKWIIARIDAKPYNNLLIAPACIGTSCIARYLVLN